MDRSFYVYCFCLHFVSWLPFPESETPHVFYKQRWILIILCWRSNRLIYWWPSKSIINEVHNCSDVTLYSYHRTFGRIFIQVALDLRGFTLRVSRLTRRLYFFWKNLTYAISSSYAEKCSSHSSNIQQTNQIIMFWLLK